MSDALNKRIDDARAKVAKIQSERDVVVEWTTKISLPLHHPPPANMPAEVDQYEKFHYLSGQLNLAQQDMSSLLLERQNQVSSETKQSIQELREETSKLVKATESQAEATRQLDETVIRLEKSSGRLEYLTSLLVAVAVLSIVSPLIPSTDFQTRVILTVILLGVLLAAFYLISENRKPKPVSAK